VTTSLGQLWRRRDAVVEHAGLALAGVRAGGPFHARLADALDRAARLETGVAVLLVGVRADDALVRRVTACTRASDTAAALGDDLLAVLVEPVSRPGDAERVAARVVELLDAAPAGLAHAGPEEIDAAELLRHAGLALDHAQRERRGGLVAFDPALLDAVAERAQLAADLPGALARGELSVEYQPVCRLATGRPVALEALARWTHPEHGPIAPATFVPLAEEDGSIASLGRWVLREACAAVGTWRAAAPGLTVSVNVSAQQLHDDAFPRHVLWALRDARLPGAALTLELGEAALQADQATVRHRLRRLERLGVAIALDTSGPASGARLLAADLPIEVLKLDGTPVNARELAGGAIVAKRIESADQLAWLRELGCELGQGFQLGPPVGPEAVPAVLA
jgi:EAL domain-containing protein (putative c-di-GMP-specific phosphodiesterase class I)